MYSKAIGFKTSPIIFITLDDLGIIIESPSNNATSSEFEDIGEKFPAILPRFSGSIDSAKADNDEISANSSPCWTAIKRDLFRAASEVSIAFSCRYLTISLVRIMPSKKASFLKSPANLYKSLSVLSNLSVYVSS